MPHNTRSTQQQVRTWTTQTVSFRNFEADQRRGMYNLEPEHQRRNVHGNEWQKDIITSSLEFGCIPAPSFHQRIMPNGTVQWESLDGKQRCNAILRFMRDELTVEFENWNEYEGEVYLSQLYPYHQQIIENLTIDFKLLHETLNDYDIQRFFQCAQQTKRTTNGEHLNSDLSSPKRKITTELLRTTTPFTKTLKKIQPNNTRPVDIDAYKVYKSLDGITDFEEIVEVEGSVTTYTDYNVVNNTSYYYYVTAIYPDGSESVPTNIVSATPVEWVECSISDGASLVGLTDTIDISVNNESLLGGLFFEIEDFPDVLVGESVITTDRTDGWSLSILDDNGKISIAGFGPLAGADPLQPGSGPVCRVVVRPQGEQSLTVSLTMTDVQIQDISNPPVQLNWTAEIGSYEVGIETQYIMLVDGHGEPGSQMTSPFCLINTQPVYGIQVDFVVNPPFISGSGIETTDLVDLSTWSVSSQQLGNVFTLLLFDNTLSNPIQPGSWYLGEVLLDVLPGSPEEFMVNIEYGEMILSDAYNQPMVSAGLPSEVYIGAPPASYSIHNVEGLLTPGGQGSFEVHLTNTEIVGTMSFEIEDLPNYLTVTSVEAVGRFENGIIDGSTGENVDDGYFYFLGYDFTGGIPVGDGPVIKINVQMGQNIQNPNVQLLFHEVSAGDAGANSITAISQGLGLFADVSLSNSPEIYVPEKFALHDNFPNPFNPSTVINYDLAVDGFVDLSIYNVVGKKVKTIVNQNETAGRKITAWYGRDDAGNSLGAGMYFYRLTAGGKVFTKKMILMK